MIQVAEGAKAAGASRIIGIDVDTKKFDIGIVPPYPPSLYASDPDNGFHCNSWFLLVALTKKHSE